MIIYIVAVQCLLPKVASSSTFFVRNPNYTLKKQTTYPESAIPPLTCDPGRMFFPGWEIIDNKKTGS